MFTHLYFSSGEFREHNWTDFFVPVRRVSASELERWTVDLTVGAHGLGLALRATFYFTLSEQSRATFETNNRELSLNTRDYILSKLFQFIFLATVVRHKYNDTDGALRKRLETFLGGIDDPGVAAIGFDWEASFSDLRFKSHGPHATVTTLARYLPSPRNRGTR